MRSSAKWIWLLIFAAFVGGFLVFQSSGLLGRGPVTTTTYVAKVNGQEIPYLTYTNASQQMAQQQEQQSGHGLTLDERRQVDEQAYSQLITEALLQQEYEKRGIRVTDAEIQFEARSHPPPEFQQASELMTDGQFDPSKYQRFLASPGARQQGFLMRLEAYYRSEIPKQKLYSQIASDVYVSDARLWQIYIDTHDTVSISYVKFSPTVTPEMKAAVSDADIHSYYDAHKSDFDRPGQATLSIVSLSRRPSVADSADTYQKMLALRAEILKGAKFEVVAKRESEDTLSAKDGGSLGKGAKGRFVKPFEDAAYKLNKGEVSQPVLTQFGYHLIKVDDKKGDTLTLRHILKSVKQNDSEATIVDHRADLLTKGAASQDVPAKFDSTAKSLGLLVSRISVTEGNGATYLDRPVPSASAWAFAGAKIGETSDLFDDDQGYYLVRLDSLTVGGIQDEKLVKDEIRGIVAKTKAIDALVAPATVFAKAAFATSLESAAKEKGMTVATAGPFTRATQVAALGLLSEAVGASFSGAIGVVDLPVKTDMGVFVIRSDKRAVAVEADWAKQAKAQRDQVTRGLREQKIRVFMENLRKAAKIEDKRKQIQSGLRRTTS
jgi:peptidyl-prolyl cis-trans isomerase D